VTVRQYVSPQRDPARRGLEFGRACAAQVGAACAAYIGLFERHAGLDRDSVLRSGAEAGEALRDHAPAAAEEIAAIARGAAQPVELLMAVNARTEILGRIPECTVIAMPGSGALAQNWDYHPDVRADRIVWCLHADEGWLTTFTEAGVLGKVGLNDRGLAVALNVLSTTADSGLGIGVPIHTVLRLVLQRCASVEQAVQMLAATPVSSSNAITVLGPASTEDPHARTATCELTPVGLRVLGPEDGALVHTNHCVHPDLAGKDLTVSAYPDTVSRIERARALVRDDIDAETVRPVLRDHASDLRGICRHDDKSADVDQSVTHASLIMCPAEPALFVSDGPPCRNPYEAVALPWA
jgi:isopenicillin-N N-acyltransferase-like protein